MKRPSSRPLQHVDRLTVQLDIPGRFADVGTLAWSRDERRAYFEYDRKFLDAPLPLSPINLAASPGLKAAPYHPFDGLHGLFNDSLPDGWGRLLLDRRLQKQRYDHRALSPLDRLAYVGAIGMGALRYIPDKTFADARSQNLGRDLELDWIASQAEQVQREVSTADVDRLQDMQGGSAGARPKIMIGLNPVKDAIVPDFGAEMPQGYEHWMVKFRSTGDPAEIGSEEYAYALMASAAGIEMSPTRLLKTNKGAYFAVRRFDRPPEGKAHIHTASGLLDVDHRTPQLDYGNLLRLTRVLTRDERDVRQMFRRMVFNVIAHNRDDHSKNHAFRMEADGAWHPASAYDLTLSDGPAGEHSLAVAGEGRNPGRDHIMIVAKDASIPKAEAESVFEEVRSAVARWTEWAAAAALSEQRISEIDGLINKA